MKDNNTGKNSDFYALGKKMLDRLNPTGPATHNFYQDVMVEEQQRMAKRIFDKRKEKNT